MSTIVVTGDTVSLSITLKKNNEVFVISPSAVVSVVIVSADHATALFDTPVNQSDISAGADWSKSLVTVIIPGSSTSAINIQGNAFLEVQVLDDGLETTWFVPIKLITGHI